MSYRTRSALATLGAIGVRSRTSYRRRLAMSPRPSSRLPARGLRGAPSLAILAIEPSVARPNAQDRQVWPTSRRSAVRHHWPRSTLVGPNKSRRFTCRCTTLITTETEQELLPTADEQCVKWRGRRAINGAGE